MEFKDLYQEIILDHYRNPRNFGEINRPSTTIEQNNPLCGDQIKLMVEFDDKGKIQDIKFNGSGCAIHQASASMMTEFINGKSLDEAKEILSKFLAIMRGGREADDLDDFGDIVSLKGVINFPVRVKCATLCWHALENALEKDKV